MAGPAPPSRDRQRGFERRAATLEQSLRRSAPGVMQAHEFSIGPSQLAAGALDVAGTSHPPTRPSGERHRSPADKTRSPSHASSSSAGVEMRHDELRISGKNPRSQLPTSLPLREPGNVEQLRVDPKLMSDHYQPNHEVDIETLRSGRTRKKSNIMTPSEMINGLSAARPLQDSSTAPADSLNGLAESTATLFKESDGQFNVAFKDHEQIADAAIAAHLQTSTSATHSDRARVLPPSPQPLAPDPGPAARAVRLNPSPIIFTERAERMSRERRKTFENYDTDPPLSGGGTGARARAQTHSGGGAGGGEGAEEGVPVPGAAGTPTRTLREQVALLQKSKDELEKQQQKRDEENLMLRKQLTQLEAVITEDVEERILNALNASPDVLGTAPEHALRRRVSKDNILAWLTAVDSPVANLFEPSNAEACEGVEGEHTLADRLGASPSSVGRQTTGPAAPLKNHASAAIKEADLLRKDLSRAAANYTQLLQEYDTLEHTLFEVQRTASGYAARYAFCLLDEDGDGLIGLEEVVRYELFLPYSIPVLQHCYQHWHFMEIPGRMNSEDFLNFTQFAEDKTHRASQLFWFSCADIDGDGYIGRHDVRWLYDHVDKSGGCIPFQDLYVQLLDMTRAENREAGISLADIRKSKLAGGVFGLLFNHNNLLLRRTTAEFSTRNDVPL